MALKKHDRSSQASPGWLKWRPFVFPRKVHLNIIPFVTVLGQDHKLIEKHSYLIHSCRARCFVLNCLYTYLRIKVGHIFIDRPMFTMKTSCRAKKNNFSADFRNVYVIPSPLAYKKNILTRSLSLFYLQRN